MEMVSQTWGPLFLLHLPCCNGYRYRDYRRKETRETKD